MHLSSDYSFSAAARPATAQTSGDVYPYVVVDPSGQEPDFRPLRGAGNVLVCTMIAIVLAIGTSLTISAARLGSDHWRRDFIVLRLDKGIDMAMFVFGLMFLVWF